MTGTSHYHHANFVLTQGRVVFRDMTKETMYMFSQLGFSLQTMPHHDVQILKLFSLDYRVSLSVSGF